MIQRLPEEATTKSGIHIPEVARRSESNIGLMRGRVLAVGPGEMLPDGTRLPMDTRPGDEVLFFRSPGAEVEVPEAGMCTIIHEPQYVAAVIER